MMIMAETKYVAVVQERFGYSEEHAREWHTQWLFQFHNMHPDACCHDVIVALQDLTEHLQWSA